MAEIEIKGLERFDAAELRRIGPGYASGEKYVVRKTESRGRVVVELELVRLERPYVRTWEPVDGERRQLYERAVARGYSLAAYEGAEPVGIALAEPQDWNRSMWVWEFHTAEGRRRRGIGRRLMEALAERARAEKLRAIVCETQNTNVPAIDFYRAVGFELEGVDLSYYAHVDGLTAEVAIFMKRRLEPRKE